MRKHKLKRNGKLNKEKLTQYKLNEDTIQKYIILVRHAEAFGDTLSLNGILDLIINLTPKIESFLNIKNLKNIYVLHSPKERTKKTADIIIKSFKSKKYKITKEECKSIDEYTTKDKVNEIINKYKNQADVLILVTHEPVIKMISEKQLDTGEALICEIKEYELKTIGKIKQI